MDWEGGPLSQTAHVLGWVRSEAVCMQLQYAGYRSQPGPELQIAMGRICRP